MWCYVITVILFLLICGYNVINGASVSIRQVGAGIAGTNNTSLECFYSNENVKSLNRVELYVFINNSFQLAVLYYPDFAVIIQDGGQYLKHRVTFKNITALSEKAVLHFENILCVDERSYKCKIKYTPQNPIKDPGEGESEELYLSVQALPSIPDNLTFTKKDDSNCPLVNDILMEGDSISILCKGSVGKPAGNLIVQKIQTGGERFNLTAESTQTYPVNCSFYQINSYMVNLTAEDNSIMLRCAEISFANVEQMYKELGPMNIRYGVRLPEIIEYYLDKPHSPPLYLSCNTDGNPLPAYSWYRARHTSEPVQWEYYASTQNITLNNRTDRGVYRCDANNTIGIQVFRQRIIKNITFEDYHPSITKVPDQKSYAIGTSKIELKCVPSNYPAYTCRWILPNGTKFNGRTYVISNAKPSQSGVYTCLLVYADAVEPTILSVSEKIIIGEADTSICQCTDCNDQVPTIIGSVLGILGLCLLIAGIIHLSRRAKLKRSDQRRHITSMSRHDGSQNYEGVTGERRDHHYDDLRQRQDNQYDNTRIQSARR